MSQSKVYLVNFQTPPVFDVVFSSRAGCHCALPVTCSDLHDPVLTCMTGAVSGRISPPLAGARITVSAAEMEPVTAVTDSSGAYQVSARREVLCTRSLDDIMGLMGPVHL